MDSGEFQYVFITTRERCIAGSWPAKHHDPKTCSNCCLRRFPIRPYNSRSPMLSSCCHNLLQSSRFHQRYQLVVARDTHKVTPTCRLTQLLHLTRNAPHSRNDQATKSIHEQLDNSQTPNTRKCNTRLHGLHQGKLCRKYLRRVDRIVTHSQQNMWGLPAFINMNWNGRTQTITRRVIRRDIGLRLVRALHHQGRVIHTNCI